MADVIYFRDQADRCRRLAQLFPDDVTSERLMALADEYDLKAAATDDPEAHKPSSAQTPPS